MAPPRSTIFDARFLRRLVGTKVTTFDDIDQDPSNVPPSAPGTSASMASPLSATHATAGATITSSAIVPSLPLPSSPPLGTWRSCIITEKLYERVVYLTQNDIDMGVGTPITVSTFLCHLEEDPAQIAFMRIYYQIPATRTEDADLATLVQQIQPPEVYSEREAFKQLMSQGCSVVPRFLSYSERTQGEHDLVPGGYIKYHVWEKVPGESLTEKYFWSLDLNTREAIRVKFRQAF